MSHVIGWTLAKLGDGTQSKKLVSLPGHRLWLQIVLVI